MSLELKSQDASLAKLSFNLPEPSADADASWRAAVGGGMVKELDEQVLLFSAEIEAADKNKSLIRADKSRIAAIAAGSVENDYAFVPSQPPPGKTSAPEIRSDVIKVSDSDFKTLDEFARKLGLADTFRQNSGAAKGSQQKVVSIKVFDVLQEKLDDRLADLNSISEMRMVRFQSLTDARKQAMMMLSNMVSSDNQVKMAIIQNLKG